MAREHDLREVFQNARGASSGARKRVKEDAGIPPIYLSVHTSSNTGQRVWTVISQELPLMADRDEATARLVYAQYKNKGQWGGVVRSTDPDDPPIWDGDLGKFVESVQEDYDGDPASFQPGGAYYQGPDVLWGIYRGDTLLHTAKFPPRTTADEVISHYLSLAPGTPSAWGGITSARPMDDQTAPSSAFESVQHPTSARPLPLIRGEQAPQEGLHRRARNYALGVIQDEGPTTETLKVQGKFLREDDSLATLQSLYDRLVVWLEASGIVGDPGYVPDIMPVLSIINDIDDVRSRAATLTPAEVQDFVLRARPFLEKKKKVWEGREITPGSPEDVSIPMRPIKLLYSNGDTSSTSINGTKKDVLNYMFQDGATGGWTDYSDSDPSAVRRVVSVEFLNDDGTSTDPRDSWVRK